MRWLIILLLFASVASAETGLIWPNNDVAQAYPAGKMAAFRWALPSDNGLPMWGTGAGNSRTGVTYMWELTFDAGAADYATTMFYSRCDGYFDSNPGIQDYMGFHPYPDPPPSSSNHKWEISTEYSDFFATNQPNAKKVVVDGQKFVQGVIVDVNDGDGTKTAVFYLDLPSTAPDDIISHTFPSGYGDTPGTSHCLQFGDAPWAEIGVAANESTQGIFRGLKIIAKTLTEADLITEAASLNTNTMQTTDGINNVWYSNVDPTPTDISDKSAAGHDPAWFDVAYKPTLYDTGTPAAVPTFLGTLITGGSIQ